MRGIRLICLVTFLVTMLPERVFAAEIQDVRIVFEHRKEAVAVRQVVTVAPGEKEEENIPFTIPLPVGAREVFVGQEDGQPTVTVENQRVVVPGPVSEEGRGVQIAYRLPILDGIVALDQNFRTEIPVAHAAFVAAEEGIVLKGNGFSRSASRTTPEGVPALFIVAAPLHEGHIQLLITGFSPDYLRILIILATVLSFSMLAVGFIIWLRRTMSPSRAQK